MDKETLKAPDKWESKWSHILCICVDNMKTNEKMNRKIITILGSQSQRERIIIAF